MKYLYRDYAIILALILTLFSLSAIGHVVAISSNNEHAIYDTQDAVEISALSASGNDLWAASGNKLTNFNPDLNFSVTLEIPAGIHSLAIETRDKARVWIATDIGVFCYNLTTDELTKYFADFLLYRVNVIRAYTDSVWLGTLNGIVVYYNDRYTTYHIPIPSLGDNVTALAVDELYLWAGTELGLARYNIELGNWTVIYDERITTIDCSENFACFGTENKAMIYDRSKELWYNYSCARITAVKVDGLKAWFGTQNGILLYNFYNNTWQNYTTAEGLLSNSVTSIAASDTTLYIGTDSGISRYDKTYGKWTSKSVADGLIAEDVQAISMLGDKMLFGTDSGLSIYNKTADMWKSYTVIDGLASNWIWDVAAINNSVYIGTDNGVSILNDNRFTNLHVEDGLINNKVYAIVLDYPEVWFGTDGGVSNYNLETHVWYNYTINNGLADNSVRDIAVCTDSVWFGTVGGATKFDKSSKVLTTYTVRDGLVSNFVKRVVINKNIAWFGTGGGVSRFDTVKNNWTSYTIHNGLIVNDVRGIAVDNGAIWFGMYGGVNRFYEETKCWEDYTVENALPNNYIYDLFVDNDAVWFGTDGGGVAIFKKVGKFLEPLVVNLTQPIHKDYTSKNVTSDNPPSLFNPTYVQSRSNITFYVSYSDEDGDIPIGIILVLNGYRYQMQEFKYNLSAKIYYVNATLKTGSNYYIFQCRNNFTFLPTVLSDNGNYFVINYSEYIGRQFELERFYLLASVLMVVLILVIGILYALAKRMKKN